MFKPSKKLKTGDDKDANKNKTKEEIEEEDEYMAISRSLMFEPKMEATVYVNPEKALEREKKKKRKQVGVKDSGLNLLVRSIF
jgi:hypothetical protein